MHIFMPPQNLRPSEELNSSVMRRIRFVYYTRKVVNPFFIEVCVLLVLTGTVARIVSFGNVISNAPAVAFGNFSAAGNFWLEAWRGAQMPAQGITVAILFVSIILCFQTVKVYKIARQQKVAISKLSSLMMQKGTVLR
jgi:hypothetical protein